MFRFERNVSKIRLKVNATTHRQQTNKQTENIKMVSKFSHYKIIIPTI